MLLQGKACHQPQQQHHVLSSRVGCRLTAPRKLQGSSNSRRGASPAAAQQTAVITGASTGIGRETSVLLASQGWRVFAGVRTPADAERIEQLHPNITPVLLEVTSQESIAAAQQQVQQAVQDGGLNLLVNNAGIGLVAPAESVPLQLWRQVLEVNLVGAVAMCQAFLPLLRQASPQKGRIINISSVAGHLPLPFWSAYNASKAGLDAVSDCLRYELAPQGVPVVLVKPGPVATPIWQRARSSSEAVLAHLPADVQERYGAQLGKMRQFIDTSERDAIPVSDVVQVLVEAATAPQPKGMYLVGKQVALLYWVKRLLPDEAWRGIIQGAMSGDPK